MPKKTSKAPKLFKKRQYYLDKLNNCKGNTVATWKAIRNIVPNNKNISISHTPGDALRKAKEFNTFFANVGKTTYEETQRMLANETGNLAAPAKRADTSAFFRPQPVDVSTVVLTIKHLQETQSFGSDGISLRFIKDPLPVTALYFRVIINTSIVTGTFSETWKRARYSATQKW